MLTRSFVSRELPQPGGDALRALILKAHEVEPFSPVRPRATARRVGALATGVGLRARLYRGALEVNGVEVDHVWLAVDDVVLDLAFPLFAPAFRSLLPRFVAGEIEPRDLESAASTTGVDDRVLGLLPPGTRYLGHPVWADRSAAKRRSEAITATMSETLRVRSAGSPPRVARPRRDADGP